MSEKRRRLAAVLVVAGVAVVAVTTAYAVASNGPSSSHTPYVLPSRADVKTVSILTVGDNAPGADADGPGYQMVGIPDGLGAFAGTGRGRWDDDDDLRGHRNGRTFTVLMNHEIRQNQGVTRDHGAIGSFVSKLTVDRKTFRVLHGDDLMQQVVLAPGGVYGSPQKGVVIGRLCSGDLPDESALYNKDSRKGYRGQLFLSGEETGHEGRAFAHALDGTSYELPYLGKMSWENALAQPGTGDRTVVIAMDDSTPGQVYVYIGEKRRDGNPVERAGLVGGKLYGVAVDGFPAEPETGIPSGTPFRLIPIENQQTKTGTAIEAESLAGPITEFKRPEDGSWNPSRNQDFYWVTTDRPKVSGGNSRLWRFNFQNLSQEQTGSAGTIDMLLNGTEGQEMMDNMTVDEHGRVLITEDPGNNPIASRIFSYEIDSDTLTELAVQKQAHGPEPNPAYETYSTLDEEISGIIPADDVLGKGWYLFDSQIHESVFPSAYDKQKLVEKGQLLALYYPVDEGDDDD